MIEVIQYKGREYPKLQSEGFAAQYAFPFAKKICTGVGFDIGFCKPEWMFPGAIGIDPQHDPTFHAMHLPDMVVDYIFSSHCLEHVEDWVGALDHWGTRLKSNGVMFLYLPHFHQEYWRPWNNRKHIHSLDPNVIHGYLVDRGYKHVFVSGIDLNSSFYVIAEK